MPDRYYVSRRAKLGLDDGMPAQDMRYDLEDDYCIRDRYFSNRSMGKYTLEQAISVCEKKNKINREAEEHYKEAMSL